VTIGPATTSWSNAAAEPQTQPTAAPAEAAAARETSGATLADRLRSLNELREAGLVTDAEFASMRAALLDKL
jgi:hypothetical protein